MGDRRKCPACDGHGCAVCSGDGWLDYVSPPKIGKIVGEVHEPPLVTDLQPTYQVTEVWEVRIEGGQHNRYLLEKSQGEKELVDSKELAELREKARKWDVMSAYFTLLEAEGKYGE